MNGENTPMPLQKPSEKSTEDASDGPSPLPETAQLTQTILDSEKVSRKNSWFRRLFSNSNDDRLRETIEELIEENNGDEDETHSSTSLHEKVLLSNILKLRDLSAYDVMVPRADIIAVDSSTKKEDLMRIYSETPRSRLPVYKGTLDNILGTVHIKDFLGQLAGNDRFNLSKITREVPIISPSMPVMDLLLQMRETRNHMALIVDEFGGIDGLVTLGDLIESITGEIDDIYDEETSPHLKKQAENIYIADARLPIEDFESELGLEIVEDDEREEIHTLAGFVFTWAGRVPAKGEIIEHPSGILFEVLDGDTRRVRKIRIRRKPLQKKKT